MTEGGYVMAAEPNIINLRHEVSNYLLTTTDPLQMVVAAGVARKERDMDPDLWNKHLFMLAVVIGHELQHVMRFMIMNTVDPTRNERLTRKITIERCV